MPDLNVSLVLRAVDRLSAPLRQVVSGVRNTGSAAEAAQQRLDQVGRTQNTIDGFRRLKGETNATAQRMKEAQARTAALAREMRQTERPSADLTRRFEAAKREAGRLKDTHQQLQQRTEQARRALQQAGVSTRDLARGQRDLTREATAANEAIERQQQRLKRLEQIQQRTQRAQEQLGRTMQLAGHTSMVAGAAGNVGQQAFGMVNDVLGSLRQVERARGELATVGVENLDLIVARGREMQNSIAGVTAASFVGAAYDIKSGISSLSDEGVAAMTAAAAVTAKATKAQTEQMTSLFATSYGIFKGQFKEMGDGEFGEMFASTLAASVQQFKTTGSAMQQAIESAGSGATNLGMRMQEQMAVLGKLQQKMQAGEAGTALAAFARSAAKAQAEFDKLSATGDNPIQVRVIDENGMLRQMPDILKDLKDRYGDTLDAIEAAEIQKAFGSDEAVKIINGLWGQEEALRGATAALNEAGSAGLSYARKMAAAADNNFDSRMVLAAQRFDTFKQNVGKALVPVIDKLLPVFDKVLTALSGWIERNPELAMTIGGLVVGVAVLGVGLAGLFSILSAAIGGFGMFRFAIQMATGRLAIMGAANTAAAGSTGLLSRAVSGLGGGLRAGGRMFAGLGRAGLALARGALPAVITGVRALGVAFMTNPIGLIIGGIALAAGLIITYWDSIGPWFGRMWEGVKEIFSGAWDRIKGILSWTPLGFIIANWGNLGSAFGRIWARVKGVISRVWERIKGILKWTPLGFIIANWGKLGSAFGQVWDRAKGVISRVWERIKGILKWTPLGFIIDNWGSLGDTFGDIFDKVKDVVGGAMDWISDKLKAALDVVEVVVDKVGGAATWVGQQLGIVDEEPPPEPPPAVVRSQAAQGGVRRAMAAGAVAATAAATPAAADGAAGPAPQVTYQNTFHIQAAPGQDPEQIARAVAKIIQQQQRGALHD